MKILFVLLVLSACAHPAPQRNLATAFVHAVDPDVRCDDIYTGSGSLHTHSAICRANKVVVYCLLADDKWPSCKAIDGSDAKQPPPASPPQGPGQPPPIPAPAATPAKTEPPPTKAPPKK